MTEYIYLIQTRESIRCNDSIQKLGMSKQKNLERIKSGYPKGSVLLLQIQVSDAKKTEDSLIEKFTKLYGKPVEGKEYFKGNSIDMVKTIYNFIMNNNELYKKNLLPITIDLEYISTQNLIDRFICEMLVKNEINTIPISMCNIIAAYFIWCQVNDISNKTSRMMMWYRFYESRIAKYIVKYDYKNDESYSDESYSDESYSSHLFERYNNRLTETNCIFLTNHYVRYDPYFCDSYKGKLFKYIIPVSNRYTKKQKGNPYIFQFNNLLPIIDETKPPKKIFKNIIEAEIDSRKKEIDIKKSNEHKSILSDDYERDNKSIIIYEDAPDNDYNTYLFQRHIEYLDIESHSDYLSSD